MLELAKNTFLCEITRGNISILLKIWVPTLKDLGYIPRLSS